MQRIATGSWMALAALLAAAGCSPEQPPNERPSGEPVAPGMAPSMPPVTGGPAMPPSTPPAMGGATMPPAASASAPGMPCDVAAVVRSRCVGCHGSPPLHGAPMSLTTADHFQQAAMNRQKVWSVARMRIEAGTMPPSSAPQLTPAEKATLLGWLAEGAPGTTGGAACTVAPPPPGPPEPTLGCPPDHTFLSRGGDAAEGYPVPTALNHYECFNFPVPFEAQEQAFEWAPVIGDARVVHHWILYAVKGTGNNCNQLKRFVVGWAPGGTTQKTPPNIGLELPNTDERLLLEVHYNNPTMLTGIKDKTGVAICTTKTPRAIEAGVITFGSTNIRIPARTRDFEVKGSCDATLTRLLPEPVHLLSSFPHMHQRGVRFATWLNRTGGTSVPVVEVKTWDFNHQAAYPHDHEQLIIRPGDSVATTCTYTNPGDQEIRFGENTENEMCFNFATVYPVSAVRALNSRPLRLCSGF
jgi:hypothetical protein